MRTQAQPVECRICVGCYDSRAYGFTSTSDYSRARHDELRRALDCAGCSGSYSLIGRGFSSPERAAFHNGALIRYLDFMDAFVAREEACHPSDNIAPLLAAAELAYHSALMELLRNDQGA